MKLTLEGLKDKSLWEAAGIGLPKYDTVQCGRDKAGACVGALWSREHFPYIYRRTGGQADRERPGECGRKSVHRPE